MLYKVALTFESADELLKKTVEMKDALHMLFGLFPFPTKKIKVFSLEVES